MVQRSTCAPRAGDSLGAGPLDNIGLVSAGVDFSRQGRPAPSMRGNGKARAATGAPPRTYGVAVDFSF